MNATASTPINKLDGFERYSVKKGTSVSDSMTISSKQLQLKDAVKGWTVEPGLYKTKPITTFVVVLFLFSSRTESDGKSSYLSYFYLRHFFKPVLHMYIF